MPSVTSLIHSAIPYWAPFQCQALCWIVRTHRWEWISIPGEYPVWWERSDSKQAVTTMQDHDNCRSIKEGHRNVEGEDTRGVECQRRYGPQEAGRMCRSWPGAGPGRTRRSLRAVSPLSESFTRAQRNSTEKWLGETPGGKSQIQNACVLFEEVALYPGMGKVLMTLDLFYTAGHECQRGRAETASDRSRRV